MKSSAYILTLMFLLLPFQVQSMTIFLETEETTYYPGDEFVTEVRLEKEYDKGFCINAVKINVIFPPDLLKIIDFSRGNSILTLWVESPNNDDLNSINKKGEFSFAGGIPGSYCGIIQKNEKSHPLARIVFQVRDEVQGTALIKLLENSAAFLHDGKATEVKPELNNISLQIEEEKRDIPLQEWQKALKKDDIPPEPFKIELHQNKEFFEGQYFIIFSTVDKQTGVDYYRVKEGGRGWQKVKSPYVLKNQELTGHVYVRAVDKSGNERISKLKSRYSKPWYKKLGIWVIIIICTLLIIKVSGIRRKKFDIKEDRN